MAFKGVDHAGLRGADLNSEGVRAIGGTFLPPTAASEVLAQLSGRSWFVLPTSQPTGHRLCL